MKQVKYRVWRRSSYSAANGNRAEVAFAGWRKSSYSDARPVGIAATHHSP